MTVKICKKNRSYAQAIQWTGENLSDISKFIGRTVVVSEDLLGEFKNIEVDLGGIDYDVCLEDFLVKESCGCFMKYSPEDFDMIFTVQN